MEENRNFKKLIDDILDEARADLYSRMTETGGPIDMTWRLAEAEAKKHGLPQEATPAVFGQAIDMLDAELDRYLSFGFGGVKTALMASLGLFGDDAPGAAGPATAKEEAREACHSTTAPRA